jgi:hypothetical protein
MSDHLDEGTTVALKGRQAYEPPTVVWEESLDVRANLAVACSKVGGSGEPCDSDNAS